MSINQHWRAKMFTMDGFLRVVCGVPVGETPSRRPGEVVSTDRRGGHWTCRELNWVCWAQARVPHWGLHFKQALGGGRSGGQRVVGESQYNWTKGFSAIQTTLSQWLISSNPAPLSRLVFCSCIYQGLRYADLCMGHYSWKFRNWDKGFSSDIVLHTRI